MYEDRLMSGRICELHVGVLILTPFLPFFYLVLQLFRQCCIFALFLFSYQCVTGYYEKKFLTMMLLHSEIRSKRVTFTGDKKHDRSAVHNILNLEKKIPLCRCNFKIQYKNHSNRGNIDAPNHHTDNQPFTILSWYKHFNKKQK